MTAAFVDILLVEDNQDDAALALRALKTKGLAGGAHHVKDGLEALDFLFGVGAYAGRAAAEPPRVVLLDLKLPRMDGFEVLRRIREHERTRRVPVVLFTSSSVEQDIARGYEAGANGYVVKPVDFDALLRTVGETGLYWARLNQTSR